jgi:hypothetical protein
MAGGGTEISTEHENLHEVIPAIGDMHGDLLVAAEAFPSTAPLAGYCADVVTVFGLLQCVALAPE